MRDPQQIENAMHEVAGDIMRKVDAIQKQAVKENQGLQLKNIVLRYRPHSRSLGDVIATAEFSIKVGAWKEITPR